MEHEPKLNSPNIMTNTEIGQKLRVMVVDDHPAFRAGLVAILREVESIEVVAEAATGAEAIAQYEAHLPEVVLLDLHLPDMQGVEVTRSLCGSYPEAKIIVVTAYEGEEDIYRSLRAGARGYLLKGMLKEDLVRAILGVRSGEHWVAPAMANRLARRIRRPNLSERELAVLGELVAGKSNKEIAAALSIAPDTVKVHVKNVLMKLDVRDRTAAAIAAVQRGIVQLGQEDSSS